MKRMADLLKISEPLPADPHEALLVTRARMDALQRRTLEVMGEFYPDYAQCVDYLCNLEQRLALRVGTLSTQEGVA